MDDSGDGRVGRAHDDTGLGCASPRRRKRSLPVDAEGDRRLELFLHYEVDTLTSHGKARIDTRR